jgi:adenine-specific DNA-methyltransferase
VPYERRAAGLEEEKAQRNRDLDPQLVWRGKDQQDWSDLVVHAPPIYIQEKVHPKALIDDLLRQSRAPAQTEDETQQLDLFSDFNGIPKDADRTDFYRHDQNWSNRMILGDSLQVMASLAEREGLRGKVQCIYLDPPYGIKFNSNFQWSTTSRDVKDGNAAHITREPEQVKAFRDTWRYGIHSYLTVLRDRFTVARDLLADSGSIFVQIGAENVHLLRAVLDEVFGGENFISLIPFSKSSSTNSPSAKTLVLSSTVDYIVWYAKRSEQIKYRPLYKDKADGISTEQTYNRGDEDNAYTVSDLTAQKPTTVYDFQFHGVTYNPLPRGWRTTESGMRKVVAADRIERVGNRIRYRQYTAHRHKLRFPNADYKKDSLTFCI